MEREKFKSRLGFILISAGCAIGIGNVWRFPYVVGNNGGCIFVLLYLLFLVIFGVPIMTMELAVGRASRASAVRSFNILEKPGSKWHFHGKLAITANYVLMFFYTTIAGWMLYYFYGMLTGKFQNSTTESIIRTFENLTQSPGTMILFSFIIIILGFGICSLGLQKGVEKITKFMMIALLIIMVVLAVNSIFLENGSEGLKFYLIPNVDAVKEIGFFTVVAQAMNQAFFTLSVGIGSMAIFGSYIDKKSSLLGEAITIASLDTFVAIVAGLIIFPACFAYGVQPDQGPSLIFITLPNIFNEMPNGHIWGGFFFLFMTFAAFSTVIAVFENLMSMCMEIAGWSRKKAAIINIIIVCIGSLPCILGFNLLSGFTPFGPGSNILDLEDFFVSNLALPFGSMVYAVFCMSRYGWGSENYYAEVNEGNGLKMPKFLRPYLTYAVPLIIIILIIYGIWTKFFM
ncbi:MAG: sodium-dependent transporter [Lachnospiraceae bacterium]|nr:sodium-dependent transporter [Lachnospiraceae bacterium]